jgi:hypothetical protein
MQHFGPKMSLKGPCIEGLVQALPWCVWVAVESLGGGACWQEVGQLGVRRIWGPLPFLSLFLLPEHHEAKRPPPPHIPSIMYCAATGLKQQGQATMD